MAWLLAEQEPGGSWFGRWGVNHLYGTGAAVPALVEAGVAPSTRGSGGPSSGWRRTRTPTAVGARTSARTATARWIGRGASTASQTAWALLALLAAGERESDATRRGVEWLVDHQQPDGSWDEPWFTGTGFPGDFSINYHLYRLTFPVMALGRYVHGAAETGGGS